MSAVHDFEERKATGEQYEMVLERFYSHEYRITPVSITINRQGIDRIFTPLDGGKPFGVEFKADIQAARTGNICAETESSAGLKEGWALTARAALLIYYLPPSHTAYEVPMERFRSRLPEWQVLFPTKIARNRDYNTVNVLVPLHHLKSIATRTRLIPPDGDPSGDAANWCQVKKDGEWIIPAWAGYGAISWTTLEARLDIAQRIWRGMSWRLRKPAA